jgi:hypothetical protein
MEMHSSPRFWYLSSYGKPHTDVVQVGERNLLTEFFHGPLKDAMGAAALQNC